MSTIWRTPPSSPSCRLHLTIFAADGTALHRRSAAVDLMRAIAGRSGSLSLRSRGGRRTRRASPKDLVCEVRLAPRREALVQGVGQDGRGGPDVDGCDARPAPRPGVADPAGEVVQPGGPEEGLGGQVEQPASDHTALPPDLGDGQQVQLVPIQLRVAQGRGLGIDRPLLEARVGMVEDVQALGLSSCCNPSSGRTSSASVGPSACTPRAPGAT